MKSTMKSTMAITHGWLISIKVRVEPVTGFTDTASRPIHLFLIQLIQTLTIEFNCDVIAQRDGQLPATIGSTAAIPRIFPTRHYSHCVKHDSSAAGTCKNNQINKQTNKQKINWTNHRMNKRIHRERVIEPTVVWTDASTYLDRWLCR